MSEKYYWLNEDSRLFLQRGYLEGRETPESRIRAIGRRAEEILKKEGFAKKFEDYMSRGWYSLASPVWANYGKKRGLPISCFGSYIDDTMEEILYTVSEVGMMSKMGGGTSAYFGHLRERGSEIKSGGHSSGPAHFMELFETVTNVVSQSNVRRGSFAGYLNIDHPDVDEFLQIRNEGHPIQNMSFGVTVSDKWMQSMVEGDKDKRKVWGKVIKKRFESGYPYIMFSDNVNKHKPKVYKDKKKTVWGSNLCSEIALSTEVGQSFVCCLSSMNLLHYEEWKDTDAVEVLTYFLDSVMSEFIEKAREIPFMKRTVAFAETQRALGIGVLGWHSYLQSKRIPFESLEANMTNVQVHKLIQEQSHEASRKMAKEYGEPELLKDYGMRNTTTMAIAPTTSSSFILGQVSPSIEPLNSNYFVKDLAKGKFTYKNPELIRVLEEHGQNNKEVWKSILVTGGSVQHLMFLTDEERAVFKTFGEISQKDVIIQASSRQKYIDQAQSLNLMIHPSTPPRDINKLLIEAWELGVKTLYYHRGTNPAQELSRNLLTCSSCEG
jgi:ribonucleoside-diphosphate reductase alpha chain